MPSGTEGLPSPRSVVSNDVSHPTRKLLRLLGPCFKTGREQHCEEGAKLCCRFLAGAKLGGGAAEHSDHRQRRCSPSTASTPRIQINHRRPTCPETHRVGIARRRRHSPEDNPDRGEARRRDGRTNDRRHPTTCSSSSLTVFNPRS